MRREKRTGNIAEVPRVLVVEDDTDYASLLLDALARDLSGVEIERVGTLGAARRALRSAPVGALLLDAGLPDGDGLAIVRTLRGQGRKIPFLVLTADASASTAIRALREGAHDYVVKGEGSFEVVAAGLRAMLDGEVAAPRGEDSALVGHSIAMRRLRGDIERYARSTAPVLIEGETGVGKELVARALHASGARSSGPFVAVNCGAFPEALAEAEFFGHVRGAYTGAGADRAGLVQHASGGTLLLDEVEDLPLSVQGKLLRLLQEGEYRPVGSAHIRKADLRVLAASNRNLRKMVGAGAFRSDLFYRLDVLCMRVAPLRERLEDLPLLIEHFVGTALHGAGLPDAAEMARLERHRWPGNIRELQNCVERARAIAQGTDWRVGWSSAVAQLPRDEEKRWSAEFPAGAAEGGGLGAPGTSGGSAVHVTRERPETGVGGEARMTLQRVLDRHRWRRDAAASELGISRATLWRRMRRYGLLERSS